MFELLEGEAIKIWRIDAYSWSSEFVEQDIQFCEFVADPNELADHGFFSGSSSSNLSEIFVIVVDISA